MADWILRGGTVIDGTGGPRRRADVAIAGDRIATVGKVAKSAGAREIDASGLVEAAWRGVLVFKRITWRRRAVAVAAVAALTAAGVATGVSGASGAPSVRGFDGTTIKVGGQVADVSTAQTSDTVLVSISVPAAGASWLPFPARTT